MADGILTPCNVVRSWHWFRQVTAPCNMACGSEIMTVNSQVAALCNVIRGSGMTCYWIRPVAAPCNVTRSSGIMTLNSTGGSTLQCNRWHWDDMPLNSPKRPPFRPHHHSRHVILHQSPKFYPNRATLGRKKWRHVDFQDGGSPPSWTLGIQ